jgi:4-amino-4-deoxy-L-arabinose transferase-like glycosyltransferase
VHLRYLRSILVAIGTGRHIACSENVFNAKTQRSKDAKQFVALSVFFAFSVVSNRAVSDGVSRHMIANDKTAPVTRRKWLPVLVIAGAVAALLAVALWLRWHYATTISLHVDEFTTLWAAKRVQQTGAPWMPSGVLYTRGLLASYVEALFLWLFGESYLVGRLPGLLFGLSAIVAIFLVGRRSWNTTVGWLAALGLTLLPEAITWSGRARFYSQFQFFALLALWAAFESITRDDRRDAASRPTAFVARHAHTLFALFFILALFSQEQMVLLYPPIVLASLLWRGGRWLLTPPVRTAHLACLLAMVVRLAIELLGQPGYFETIQAQRPYVGLVFDVIGAWRVYAPLFIAPERLLWSVLGIVALVAALWGMKRKDAKMQSRKEIVEEPALREMERKDAKLQRRKGVVEKPALGEMESKDAEMQRRNDSLFASLRLCVPSCFHMESKDAKLQRRNESLSASLRLCVPSRFHQATLFYGLNLLFVLAVIFLLVGTSWREARYLFLVQPLWLLLGAAGAAWLIGHLPRSALRVAATVALSLLLLATMWQPAQRVLSQQVEGYDLVLAHLAQQRQTDDLVLSPQPPACALALGVCDGYALQRGYEEFVIERDGVLIDRWTGSPLVNTTQQLEQAIRSGRRVWFVSDAFRLATRYEADFLRMLIEQFDVAFEQRGVMALLAQGWREQPAPVAVADLTPPARFGPLALTGWQRGAAQPGADLAVTLFWTGNEPIGEQINTSVRVVAADGSVVAQADGPPARGIIPTTLFFDTPLLDPKRLALPADLPDGRYRIETTAYRLNDPAPLAELLPLDWFVVGPATPPPAQPLAAAWQNGLRLLGHDGLPERLPIGGALDLRLVWAADAPLAQNLTAFVQLIGPDGSVVSQHDRLPLGGFYPTSGWDAGEPVEDRYSLALPQELPAGEYGLLVGWYDPISGERVRLAGGEDTLEVARWGRSR